MTGFKKCPPLSIIIYLSLALGKVYYCMGREFHMENM